MKEKELIKGIINNQKKAIRYFCKEYRGKLMKMVGSKIGRKEDIEEIVQDSLLSAIDAMPGFKGNSSLKTFVYAIARHETADFYRRKKIKEIVFSKLPFLKSWVSQALGPELAYQELETKRRILNTLKNINEGYSEVLRLKYIEELSVKEMAQILKISAKAVESKLSRARLAFQKVYVKNKETAENYQEFFEEAG